jgi:GTPase SAR1 family protein
MPPGFLNRDIVLLHPITPGGGPEATGGEIAPLEPDFPGTIVSPPGSPVIEDGRIENRFSRLLGTRRPEITPPPPAGDHIAGSVMSARPVTGPVELCFFRVNSLESCAFEIIGAETEVLFQFVAAEREHELLARQLRAHLPEFDIRRCPDVLAGFDGTSTADSIVVPFGLSDRWFRPIPTGQDLGTDPLIPLVGALDGVGRGEIASVQVMFGRTRHPWQRLAREELFDASGKPAYSNLADQIKGIRQKLSDPLAAAAVRLWISAAGLDAATRLARGIMPYFKQFGSVDGNSLVPLRTTGSAHPDTAENVLARTSHKSGILLTLAELSSLVRFPSDALRSPKLKRYSRKEKRAPEVTTRGSIVLGLNPYRNEEHEVRLSREQRTRHMHVIGSSGSGKTTLLMALIKSDIENNDGVCVIDLHGDLTDIIMENVPDRRVRDVVLFDAADDFPIGFNPLHANSPLEKNILLSDLTATFRRMSTTWGDRMDSLLGHAVSAFLESTRGGTLMDLRRFMVEKEFRREFLETVTDDAVRYFWEHEFQLITGNPQASILIRLDGFLRQALIRGIVCQRENRLDFRRLMDEKKILLVKLAQGLIGEENAHLLGTMILSRIYQAALSRQDSHDRPYWWATVDEFHHLITPSMERILSGARKYNLGLILAHQEFKQLQTRSQEVASSVMSNSYTRVCFRLGDADAEKFAGGFSSFDAKALQNLGIGEAIARIERADYDFNLSVDAVPKVENCLAQHRMDSIREFSRKTYGRPRSEVEKELSVMLSIARPQVKKKPKDEKPTEAAGEPTSEHKYLQDIVKRIGERCGYRATIELPVMGGVGKIDVALEDETRRIAVEIARTNTSDYELRNIQKCLAAGFDRVAILSSNAAHLRRIRQVAEEALDPQSAVRLHFLHPEQLHPFLSQLPTSAPVLGPKEEKIKGYRVKTVLRELSESEARAKRNLVRGILDNTGDNKGSPSR